MTLEKKSNNLEIALSSKQKIQHNLPTHKAPNKDKFFFEEVFVLISKEGTSIYSCGHMTRTNQKEFPGGVVA